MRIGPELTLFLTLAALSVACREPAASGNAARPAFSTAASVACPSHATFVVSDEAALLNAIATAQPNDTIALNGMIELAGSSAFVTTNSLTFTCASPGSGLRARAGAGIDWLFIVLSKHVTVEQLTLDATNNTAGAFVGTNSDGFADHVTFRSNAVTCVSTLSQPCVYVVGVGDGFTGGAVTDNDVRSDGVLVPVEIVSVDSAVVARNRVTAVSPATCQPGEPCSAILANNTPHLTLSNNVVTGGWARGLDLALMHDGSVVGNRVTATAPGDVGIGAIATGQLLVSGDTVLGPWVTSLRFEQGLASSTVSGNRLDGATDDAIDVEGGTDVQVTRNTVTCGPSACAFFFSGALRVFVTDNTFTSAGSGTGLHMQTGIDGSHVERNTIIATSPSTAPDLGGIRVRDGTNVVVADNTVRGPWANSIAATDLTSSDFERNSLQGAALYGIRLASGVSFIPISMTDNMFRNNLATGASSAGMFARLACNNEFIGNNLQRNAGNVGAVFDVTTGANTLVGDGTIVVDNGSFDCNGDGALDPNVITGLGPVRRGVPFATPSGGATTTRRGIGLQ